MRWDQIAGRIRGRRAGTEAAYRGEPRLAGRYEPCDILKRRGIACVVWFEDALALYGSDTVVFELYVLVQDVSKAKKVLTLAGYKEPRRDPKAAEPIYDDRIYRGGVELERASGSPGDAVVLISADAWEYDVAQELAPRRPGSPPLPLLDKFIDSLMSHWLNMSEGEYKDRLLWAMSLASLIYYAYNLQGPEGSAVRAVDFAQRLRPEHRELHYDLVGRYPQKVGISSYRKHEYHAMRCREIREGRFVARPYPTANVPVSLAEYPHLTGLDACYRQQNKSTRSRVSVTYTIELNEVPTDID
jgi:hypothetical protein